MKFTRDNDLAFSLVEVVLALGIVSFALVALLGLLSVGLKSSKQAGDDTEVAAITWQVVSKLRNATPTFTVGTPISYCYDIRGQEVPATSSLSYYICSFNSRRLPNTEVTANTINAIVGKLEITWPASAPAGKRPNTNLVHVTFPPR